MEELNFGKDLIIRKMKELECVTNDPYLEVYSLLMQFTQRQVINDYISFVGLAHMVYGWMPTIITIDSNIEINEQVFEKVSKGILEFEFLAKLKHSVNNSIVGVSKLLHFLNSQDYAIWDSRVYSSITRKKAYNYNVNSVEIYICYMKKIKEICEEIDLKYVRSELIRK